jgi:hypothetical protein
VRSNLPRATGFGILSIAPFLVYLAYLYEWLGDLGKGVLLEWLPFVGLVTSREWELKRQGVVIVSVVIPSLLLTGAVIAALRRGIWKVEFAFLLTNVLLFVVLLNRLPYGDGYTSVGRVTTGIVLAAVLCIPWLEGVSVRARRLLVVSFALWLSMLPVIFVYGFGG